MSTFPPRVPSIAGCLRRGSSNLIFARVASRHQRQRCSQRLNSTSTRPQQATLSIKPTSALRAESATAPKPATTTFTKPATTPSPQSAAAAPRPPYTPPLTTTIPPAGADLTDGLNDFPVTHDESGNQVDWARSFHGLSAQPFDEKAAEVLTQPIPADDIEVKPDGIVYLPEIKYRRILNKAFGPGGWGLAPRGETIVTDKSVTREYALVAHGR